MHEERRRNIQKTPNKSLKLLGGLVPLVFNVHHTFVSNTGVLVVGFVVLFVIHKQNTVLLISETV